MYSGHLASVFVLQNRRCWQDIWTFMLHMCQNSVRRVRKEEALLELVYKYCKLEKL